MKNRCDSCRHWNKLPAHLSVRSGSAGEAGECRAFPPLVNFSFPRTAAADFCGCWEAPTKPLDLASHRKRVARSRPED